jgi:P pilus assembly chaperone PapD
MKKVLLLLALFAGYSLNPFKVNAQISIAPTTVFMDQNGIGSLFITNPSDVSQEISISFTFGYPGNDELGNLIMVYGDDLKEKQNGLGDRVRSFPRTFILAPKQQQTVRLQVRPDRSLAAGTYFTRVKVTSNAQTPDVEQTNTEGVSTQVNFKFDQVIAAFYKVGAVNTGLEFGEVTTSVDEGVLKIVPQFQVTGNSPYLGSVTATLRNSSKEIIAEHDQTVALYFAGKRAIDLKIPENLPAGAYEIELLYETKRSDIPSSDLVKSPTITKTISMNIQ